MAESTDAFQKSSLISRTPPNALNQDNGTSCCQLCSEPDNTRMVMCDACDMWFHFACVSVDSHIENEDWSCEQCNRKATESNEKASPEIPPPNTIAEIASHANTVTTVTAPSSGDIINQPDLNTGNPKPANHKIDSTLPRHYQPRIKAICNEPSSAVGQFRGEFLETNNNRHASIHPNKAQMLINEYRRNFSSSAKTAASAANEYQVTSRPPGTFVDIQSNHSNASTRASSQRKKDRVIQKLAEEFAIREKRESDYIEQKYKLLDMLSSGESEDEYGAVANKTNIAEWLSKYKHIEKGRDSHREQAEKTFDVHKPIPAPQSSFIETRQRRSTHNFPPAPLAVSTSHSYKPNPIFYRQNQDAMATRVPRVQIDENASHQPPTSRPIYGDNHSFPRDHPGPSNSKPPEDAEIVTARRIVARQVMAKELPSFSGSPEDWPIFISSFENSTRACDFTLDENLLRLQRCLKGRALDAVRSSLLLPENVPRVIDTLRMLYGRPDLIVHTLLQKIKNQPAPKPDRLDTLINFALAVQNLCSTMEASGLTSHLNNPTLLQELTDKLPTAVKLDWAMHKMTVENATLSTFATWLYMVAEAASGVTMYTNSSQISEPVSEKRSTSRVRGQLHTHAESTHASKTSTIQPKVKNSSCRICDGTCSNISLCHKFANLSHNDKWNAVRDHQLCRKCLNPHGRTKCRYQSICNKNGCTFKHHRLLHNDDKDKTSQPFPGSSSQSTNADQRNIVATQFTTLKPSILFRIIPVTLSKNGTNIHTYAFLDDGSSLTLMEEAIAAELGVSGVPEPLCLSWTNNIQRKEKTSIRVSLEIMGRGGHCQLALRDVRTVKTLNLPKQSVNMEELKSANKHLKGVPIESYSDAVPRVLIGIDNLHLQVPLKIKQGADNEPVAAKTRLGWTVYGPVSSQQSKSIYGQNFHHQVAKNICECGAESDNDLHQLVKDYFTLESLGVSKPIHPLESNEDKRAHAILDTTTIRTGNRFETGLLWKYDLITLPDSLPMARKRLDCLRKRCIKEPDLATILRNQISDYVSKGYARKLSDAELKVSYSRIWYLPIFVVKNPSKPNKVRMVWDAAAKVKGISLNSVLLKGPDQLASLTSVLLRFRERSIAISADIKEMFHQVRIRKEDQQAQRFIWSDDLTAEPNVYVMQVMTFGATCSPSSAQFIKNTNAQMYSKQFPRAVNAIVNNHYVDDLLESLDSEDEAIQIANEIKWIHEQAGFTIRNWISNSSMVLRALGDHSSKKLPPISLNLSEDTEKVLGMFWSTTADTFTYSLIFNKTNKEILYGERRPTKREVLRTLMSIFDPLGFLSFFLVYAKILLQDIWRERLDWDDGVTDNQLQRWLIWIRLLPMVEKIQIPRWYRIDSSLSSNHEIELHTFVDASEDAYGVVTYLRIVTNSIHCSLVGAKSRVAPLKATSIPRLELEAANLGSRFANSISASLTIPITKKYFWTDSKTVLCWLRSDQRKYRQFVAFRVGEILESTELTDWRWIPTKLNVADETTKWQRTPSFQSSSRWFSGPSFLQLSQDQWPEETPTAVPTTEEDLRPCYHHNVVPPASQIQLDRFAHWNRLVRSTAIVFRYVSILKNRIKATSKPSEHIVQAAYRKLQAGNFSKSLALNLQEEFVKAENFLYRIAQFDEYPDEVTILQSQSKQDQMPKKFIEKSSRIYNRSPYLDSEGVLRVRGRIDAAIRVPDEMKRPIILPHNHHITKLIIRHYHQKYHHHNNNTVLNELRQRYDIPRLRVVLKSEIRSCQKCKNDNAYPKPPEMADLPLARLATFSRPFSYIGIDYFGPIAVKIGRRAEKRWGVLVTCLTTRAIHIEIAHTMSTDSCIMCIRNMIARRGTPVAIYSDNGTNFHGAERELRDACENIDRASLSEKFTSSSTSWHFNPPSCPHMGGSWERLVRSVKNTLYRIMPDRNPSDELLRTMLMEVESIVNSRPLTYVPIETHEDEAITPNHFLLGSSDGSKPAGSFDDNGALLKKNWMTAQQYANSFWKRWIQEYLPTITRRSKWFQPVRPISIGDVVVIADEKNPRNTWPKGRVLEVFPGKDGQVRKATVRTIDGVFQRPAVKLAVLDVGKNDGRLTELIKIPGGSVSDQPNDPIFHKKSTLA